MTQNPIFHFYFYGTDKVDSDVACQQILTGRTANRTEPDTFINATAVPRIKKRTPEAAGDLCLSFADPTHFTADNAAHWAEFYSYELLIRWVRQPAESLFSAEV